MIKKLSLFIFTILIFNACSEPQPKRVTVQKKAKTQTSKISVEEYAKMGISEESIKNLNAISVGAPAPDFTAKDQAGNSIQLSRLTQKGDVVLVFYRGFWCGYCTKYLATYVEKLKTLEAKGVTVLAIAPEGEKNITKTIESTELEIPFISDNDHEIMDKYGVAFKVNEDYNQKVKKYKSQTLNEINGQEEAYLPIPATYIIGKDGKVKWAHFDPDYSKRATVEEVMANL